MIKLGYCCQNLSLQTAGINYRTTTETSLRGHTHTTVLQKLAEICIHNLRTLRSIMYWNTALNIWCYRIPTNIFPLFDHPAYTWVYTNLLAGAYFDFEKLDRPSSYDALVEFTEAKDAARAAVLDWACAGADSNVGGVWLGTHPGQYTVISSRTQSVNIQGIATLRAQIDLLDILGVNDDPAHINHNINIHVSNGSKSVKETAAIVYEHLNKLSEYYGVNMGAVLSFENEDKGIWTPETLLKTFPDIPVCFDAHHYRCNHPKGKLSVPDTGLLKCIHDQWQRIRNTGPLWHHSSPKNGLGAENFSRSHADYMENEDLQFLDQHQEYFDAVELEVKMKDLALIKASTYLKKYDKTTHK